MKKKVVKKKPFNNKNLILGNAKNKKQTALLKARVEKLQAQKDLAKSLGISTASYSSIEIGKRLVRPERAEKIAKLLKLNTAQAFKKSLTIPNKYIAK